MTVMLHQAKEQGKVSFGITFALSSSAVFSSRREKFRDNVALWFVCGNYCLTMD